MRSADGKFYEGVCFFMRSLVNFRHATHRSVHQLKNLCIEIRKPSSKPFLVGTWCRTNSTVYKYLFESFVGRLDAENIEYHLLGDVNRDIDRPGLHHPTRVLTCIADLYILHQLIGEPTRIIELSSTTIDLIFTNEPDKLFALFFFMSALVIIARFIHIANFVLVFLQRVIQLCHLET